MRSVVAFVFAFVTCQVLPAGVRADAAPPVAVDVDACVPVDRSALETLVAIELGTSIGASAAASRRAALTRVRIGCAQAGVAILLDDGLTRKSITRVVDLASVEADARTRLLALATAELVVASWIELTLEPPPVAPVGPPPPPRVRSAATRVVLERRPRRTRPRVDLGTGVQGTLWTSRPGPLGGVGAQLDVTHRVFEHLGWNASAGFERGFVRVAVEEGAVDMTTTVHGTLAPILHGKFGAFDLAAGAGYFFAFVYLEGHARTGADLAGREVRAPVAGPALVGRVALRVDDRLAVVLRAEGAFLTLPERAVAPGGTVLDLDGARVALAVGLAIGL